MKPLFKPGEEVVCLKGKWRVRNYLGQPSTNKHKLPVENEIYRVADPNVCVLDGEIYINLEDFPEHLVFKQTSFAAVLSTFQLKRELTSIFQPITK